MVTFDQLMLPLMKALVNRVGSGSVDEIYEEVVELENFDEETLAVLHNPEKSNQTAYSTDSCHPFHVKAAT